MGNLCSNPENQSRGRPVEIHVLNNSALKKDKFTGSKIERSYSDDLN